MNARRCQAHAALMPQCDAHATTLVEWHPLHNRGAHDAAGNTGHWPHNGARRLALCDECAAELLTSEPDWASEVRS